MSYAHIQLLNVNVAPSLARAASIIEAMNVMSDPGPIYAKLGVAKGLQCDLTFDSHAAALQRLAEGQSFCSVRDFMDEAYELADRLNAKRVEIAQDKWLKKERDRKLFEAMEAGDATLLFA